MEQFKPRSDRSDGNMLLVTSLSCTLLAFMGGWETGREEAETLRHRAELSHDGGYYMDGTNNRNARHFKFTHETHTPDDSIWIPNNNCSQ